MDFLKLKLSGKLDRTLREMVLDSLNRASRSGRQIEVTISDGHEEPPPPPPMPPPTPKTKSSDYDKFFAKPRKNGEIRKNIPKKRK